MTEQVTHRTRDAIFRDLESADDELRRLAIDRLLEIPAVEAVPRLLDGLGDSSWRVRKAAVERLVSCPEAELIDSALIRALADGDNTGRRNSAFEALVGIGARVTERLIASLADDDIDVRKLVVDALGGIADPASCSAVIGALADPDTNVRAAAADALGVIGDARAVEAMQHVVVDDQESQLVRLSALRALAQTQHQLRVEDLEPALADELLRPAVFELLGQVGDEAAIGCLLKGLETSSRPSREAGMAGLLRVLSQCDGEGIDALLERIREVARADERLVASSIERLQQADLATRMTLVQFLGLTMESRVVIPILVAGRDEAITEVSSAALESLGEVTVVALREGWSELDLGLRSAACEFLARSEGGREATSLLLASLEDPDPELRTAAAGALGALRCEEALIPLTQRLERTADTGDSDAEAELSALVEALVNLASSEPDSSNSLAREVIERLTSRLGGAEDDVRFAIASVLGRIGRREDEEMVAGLLRDPSPRVRRAAVDALARLEPGAASEPLRLALADESPLVRVAAAVALGESTNPEVIDDLSHLINDADPRVSAAAVRSIAAHCRKGHMPIERALALVAHALACEGIVALAAVDALNTIGGREAAAAAVAVLDRAEPEPVQAAVACIGTHGDPETLLELVALVPHPAWTVRAEAIQTLADKRVSRAIPAILRRLEAEQDSFVRDVILRALRQLED